MLSKREPLVFALTLAGAASLLVSIAAGELFLMMALVTWIACRSRPPNLPSFFIPMCAFIATTIISLLLSPEPAFNWALRKTVLFAMTFLAATFVTTVWRARTSYAVLLAIAALTSSVGLVQFGFAYVRYLNTQQLADDPTVLARITGTMGHWLTFSGEQMLVWCAAIPAIVCLGRRWFVPLTTVGAALILSFTRGVWAGSIAAVAVISAMMPKRVLLTLMLPLVIVAAASSGLIYHRLKMSLDSETRQNFAPDTGRIELWKTGVQMIHDHPWFGVGPERIYKEFPSYYRGAQLPTYYGHLENNYLQIAAERGLICFATFLWFVFELYAGLIALFKASDEGARWIALSALAALTGFLVSGLFEYNFGDSEILLLLLFIVTMPFGVLHERNVEAVG